MVDGTTQRERVLRRLVEEGTVDNFWAFNSYILRLGAIIHGLRQEGYEIDGMFGKEYGLPRPQWKNYIYVLKNKAAVDTF